ncbi:MAG: hypothetical protein ABL958_05885 [Bdellovibrionia bacterium]
MSHFKKLICIVCLGGSLCFPRALFACDSLQVSRNLPKLMTYFFGVDDAIHAKSMVRYKKAVKMLVGGAKKLETDSNGTTRSTVSAHGSCSKLLVAVMIRARALESAKSLADAKRRTAEFKHVLTLWAYRNDHKPAVPAPKFIAADRGGE